MERFAWRMPVVASRDTGGPRHPGGGATVASPPADMTKLLATAIRVVLLLAAAAGFAQRSGIVSVFWF